MPLDELTKLKRAANHIEPIKTRARALKIPPITPEEKATDAVEVIRITRPKIREAVINIRGMADSPYVQHAFSEKARKQMEETQRQGQQAKGKQGMAWRGRRAMTVAQNHFTPQNEYAPGVGITEGVVLNQAAAWASQSGVFASLIVHSPTPEARGLCLCSQSCGPP